MRIAIDIEANKLIAPDKIWCIVCKDIDTHEYRIFRHVDRESASAADCISFLERCKLICGHNLVGYDIDVISRIIGYAIPIEKVIDTLVVSKMADYSRKKHSIESYGLEFGLPKIDWKDFSKYDERMVEYCLRDVDICHKIYEKYKKFINKPSHQDAIRLEHDFAYTVVNSLHRNGFCFNLEKAKSLLTKVEEELAVLNNQLATAFPPRLKVIREVTPRATKYGTISLASIPVPLRNRLDEFTVGGTFSYCHWVDFNPSSHKQLIEVLSDAGWSPVNKTDTHIDTERELNVCKDPLTKRDLQVKLDQLRITGWKIDEENLSTLPPKAPEAARLLAKRILYESRRRTLVEWIGLCGDDGRIHGDFQGIGAWTHRMAHQRPNTANIPNEFDNDGKRKPLGKEFRQLWRAPKGRLLVGVDAEGIQLRIFAHYINDPEFTAALETGKKEDKSDPHSLNQRILGPVCKTRQQAKRFIYALLLGGGIRKLAEILGCEQVEAEAALERLLGRYEGFAYLKREVIPKDARRGWFTGLDGRSVAIPSDTLGGRKHLAMSGYLQNGEKVIMARASLKWHGLLRSYDALLVDFVHDEWQVEAPNDVRKAMELAEIMSQSLVTVGEELNLKCKLAGSYWNDDHKDYTIGSNWYQTH